MLYLCRDNMTYNEWWYCHSSAPETNSDSWLYVFAYITVIDFPEHLVYIDVVDTFYPGTYFLLYYWVVPLFTTPYKWNNTAYKLSKSPLITQINIEEINIYLYWKPIGVSHLSSLLIAVEQSIQFWFCFFSLAINILKARKLQRKKISLFAFCTREASKVVE